MGARIPNGSSHGARYANNSSLTVHYRYPARMRMSSLNHRSAPDSPAAEPRHREYVQGLQRGFAVVKAFSADGNRRLTVADVAGRTGLTRAVARRYLLTLQELGYVVHD